MPSRRLYSTIRQNLIRIDHELRAEILAELQDAGLEIERGFKKVTQSWRHKPDFTITTEIGIHLISVTVVPKRNHAGQIWKWIDEGTGKFGKRKSAYPIRPKTTNPTQTLRFQTPYFPRTAPVAQSGGPGVRGTRWVSKKEVMHPGIEGRKFTVVAVKKLRPPFETRIENAIRRGIRRAAR